jgi:hypothetical protein
MFTGDRMLTRYAEPIFNGEDLWRRSERASYEEERYAQLNALSAGGPTEDRLQPASIYSQTGLLSHVQQIRPFCVVDCAVAMQLQLVITSQSFRAALRLWLKLADGLDASCTSVTVPTG